MAAVPRYRTTFFRLLGFLRPYKWSLAVSIVLAAGTQAAAIVREIFKPFEDIGVMGASATSSRATGGTDSTSFNNAGLPGIGFGQDPIEYQSATWHTNLDTYERIIEQDAKQSAMTIASLLYHLAMRDEMLPRFPAAEMPPVPQGRGGGRGN